MERSESNREERVGARGDGGGGVSGSKMSREERGQKILNIYRRHF